MGTGGIRKLQGLLQGETHMQGHSHTLTYLLTYLVTHARTHARTRSLQGTSPSRARAPVRARTHEEREEKNHPNIPREET